MLLTKLMKAFGSPSTNVGLDQGRKVFVSTHQQGWPGWKCRLSLVAMDAVYMPCCAELRGVAAMAIG